MGRQRRDTIGYPEAERGVGGVCSGRGVQWAGSGQAMGAGWMRVDAGGVDWCGEPLAALCLRFCYRPNPCLGFIGTSSFVSWLARQDAQNDRPWSLSRKCPSLDSFLSLSVCVCVRVCQRSTTTTSYECLI